MSTSLKNIVILGSTGSIGCSTLDVVRALANRFRVVGITGHSNLELLKQQATEFSPDFVVVSDESQLGNLQLPATCQSTILAGQDGIVDLVTRDDVDLVVSAIVGSAGLRGTWAAIEAGKTLSLIHI